MSICEQFNSFLEKIFIYCRQSISSIDEQYKIGYPNGSGKGRIINKLNSPVSNFECVC